jgi:hypothetical protein
MRIEVILPTIGRFSAPTEPLPRELVVPSHHPTAQWVRALREADVATTRLTLLESYPDDPRALEIRGRVGSPFSPEFRKLLANAWRSVAYDTIRPTHPVPPLDYHGIVELPDGDRGIVSIPILRAIADLGAPIYLELGRLSSTLTRPDGTRRGFGARVDIHFSRARKPRGYGYLPELGPISPLRAGRVRRRSVP